MKTDWRQCEGDFVEEDLYVSINRRGEIVMGADAYREIGEPVHVALLWDEKTRRIGVKEEAFEDGWRFPIALYGRGGRTNVVRAARLLKKFGIEVGSTLRFRDVYSETIRDRRMLVLDLDNATPITRKSNGGRNGRGLSVSEGESGE